MKKKEQIENCSHCGTPRVSIRDSLSERIVPGFVQEYPKCYASDELCGSDLARALEAVKQSCSRCGAPRVELHDLVSHKYIVTCVATRKYPDFVDHHYVEGMEGCEKCSDTTT